MRWIVTKVKADPHVPARYRRRGWMAFDTEHERHGQVWTTKTDARKDAARLERAAT